MELVSNQPVFPTRPWFVCLGILRLPAATSSLVSSVVLISLVSSVVLTSLVSSVVLISLVSSVVLISLVSSVVF